MTKAQENLKRAVSSMDKCIKRLMTNVATGEVSTADAMTALHTATATLNVTALKAKNPG